MPKVDFTDLIVPNGGINESVSPQKIKPNEWTSALNVEPLFDGCRRRNGSTASNAVANGGSGPLSDEITMVADYRLSDASTAYHLVSASGKLYKNVAGTMTEITGAASGDLTFDSDLFPSWAVMNDRFALTNNTEVSRICYDVSSTLKYENEGIAPPTATPTFTTPAGSSGFSAGEWRLDYYYYNEDTGVSSDRRYNGVDALEITLVSGDDIVIDAGTLPTAVARTGDRATHIRIELMSVADGQTIFRFAKQVTLAEAASAVTINETDLGGTVPAGVEAEYEHAVAPVHKLKLAAENRQFIANIADAPYRLMFSPIIGTTPHYHSFPTLNKRDFGKGDGDYITALAFLPPRTLIVGLKNSIKAIDARRPGTSDVVTISENVGIAGPNAFSVIGRKLFFHSDADKNKGPYVLESVGQEPRYLFGLDDTYKGLNQARLKHVSCAQYAPGDNRFQWWSLVTAGGSIVHDRVLVYDYVLDAWTIYSKPSANVLGEIEESSVGKVYIGGNDGVEHLQDTGYGDSDTAYVSTVGLGVFDMGANHIKKRMRWLDYIVSGQTQGAVNVRLVVDYGQSWSIQAVLDQTAEAGATWDSGSTWGGGAVWGAGGTDIRNRTTLCGRGHTFQPKLSFSSTKQSGNTFHLKGLAFGYQMLRNKVVA